MTETQFWLLSCSRSWGCGLLTKERELQRTRWGERVKFSALSSTIVSKPRQADGTKAGLTSHTKRNARKNFLRHIWDWKQKREIPKCQKSKRNPSWAWWTESWLKQDRPSGSRRGFNVDVATEDEALSPEKTGSWNKGPVYSPQEDRTTLLAGLGRRKELATGLCHKKKWVISVNLDPKPVSTSLRDLSSHCSFGCRSQDIEQSII